MTLFDLIVICLVGASVVAGALRGVVRALIATVALFAGLLVAAQTYEWAGGWLRSLGVVETRAAADAAGFLLVAFLFLSAGFAAGALLRDTLRRAKLGWLDRALGASFGCLRGVAVCSAMYLALTAFPVRLGFVRDARTAPALAEGARVLTLVTSSDLRARFLAQYRRAVGLAY
ncbi:MAG TPA: CvpA family protein [Pyrinomonadaceae bacterium]|jgi:membrane protein required for colicin V production|nr:CvpA family protein [Pyrinomonadaceae bacterium]